MSAPRRRSGLTDVVVRETPVRGRGPRLTYLLGVAGAALLALVAVACGDDEVTSSAAASASPAVIDGELDCPANERREPPAEIAGPEQPTSEDALRYFLAGAAVATDGEIAILDGRSGSVVLGGREVAVAQTFEGAEGGWLARTSYCAEAGAADIEGPNPPRTEPPVTASG